VGVLRHLRLVPVTPSASVDAGYGPILDVDPHMLSEVLGSSPSMFERDIIGHSSAAEVV
jgi:hypothetical protein